MGEIAVLNPQNVLKNRFPRENLIYSITKSRRNSNPNPNPNPNFDSNPNLNRSNDRRKRSPTKVNNKKKKNGNKTTPLVENQPQAKSNLVIGQVKILKRGEALTETAKTMPLPLPLLPVPAAGTTKSRVTEVEKKKENLRFVEDLALSLTARLGPEPEMVPKKVNLPNFYAGSAAFVTSPPPSSLPLPGFFKKKSVLADINDASTDLRRILGLDFA